MQIEEALANAEQAYEQAVAAGQVKTLSGGVKRYTQADFAGQKTDDAARGTSSNQPHALPPGTPVFKPVDGKVKHYKDAAFPGKPTAAAEQVGASSVSVVSGGAGVTITISQP